MMPACTGLPPGELISSTTALAPFVFKGSAHGRHDHHLGAGLAAEAISPLISTSAVCGVETSGGVTAVHAIHTRKTKNASHDSRTKVRQRAPGRFARPGGKRQLLQRGALPAGGRLRGTVLAGWPGRFKNSVGSGMFGSVISELNGLRLWAVCQCTTPSLGQGDLDQAAAARPATHCPGVGAVHGPVGGAHQPLAGQSKKRLGW
jgi:hypothetical protein